MLNEDNSCENVFDLNFDEIVERKKSKATIINANAIKSCKIKKKKGGFRPVLVSLDELKDESKVLEVKLKELVDKWTKGCLNEPDAVSLYIIIYVIKRYPKQFLENFDQIYANTDKSIDSKCLNEHLNLNEKLKTRFKQTNTNKIFDLINNYNLHSIPKSARISIVNWYLGVYDLKLYSYVPTVEDVVELQANKRRCVTIISDRLDELVEGHRDPLSFVIHDLVHAHKMFDNFELLKGQVAFSICMFKIINCDLIKDLLKNDEEFCENFNYCVSDMNSHTKHLFFTFKTSLLNAYKRKYMLKEGDLLTDNALNEFNKAFNYLLAYFEMNESEIESANRMLNDDKPFDSFDFRVLNDYFLNLYDKYFNKCN